MPHIKTCQGTNYAFLCKSNFYWFRDLTKYLYILKQRTRFMWRLIQGLATFGRLTDCVIYGIIWYNLSVGLSSSNDGSQIYIPPDKGPAWKLGALRQTPLMSLAMTSWQGEKTWVSVVFLVPSHCQSQYKKYFDTWLCSKIFYIKFYPKFW